MKILIVEDDPRLLDVLRRGLAETGHVVDVEVDGEAGEATARAGAFDALVLDVMLPRRDGVAVARNLRVAGVSTPIVMLTARDTTDDAIAGLDAGADDYLRKPFSFAELEARLRAVVRRPAAVASDRLVCGDLVFDLRSREARRGEREISLTAREAAFLEYFMRNAGMLVTRPMLEDALWERDRDTSSNVIDVYVRRLRAKLGVAGEPPLISTVRGAGYRFGIAVGRVRSDDATR